MECGAKRHRFAKWVDTKCCINRFGSYKERPNEAEKQKTLLQRGYVRRRSRDSDPTHQTIHFTKRDRTGESYHRRCADNDVLRVKQDCKRPLSSTL